MDGFNDRDRPLDPARKRRPSGCATLIIEGVLAAGRAAERARAQRAAGPVAHAAARGLPHAGGRGLLLQLPNRGAQVVALSREDVCHAFEVMASLEGLAGELAAARVTDADLDDLRALQGEMERRP